jgi:hypothetical protein
MSKGIDIPIDALIDSFMTRLWTSNNNQFYGRIFRNEKKEGSSVKVVPIYYDGSEGIDPLRNDNKDAQCFVDVMPTRKMFADVIEAECRVLFMVGLSSLYPTLNRTEAIEQVMSDVKNVLIYSGFNIIQMVSGYEAFKDYGWSEDDMIDLTDHLFRFDLKITYTND